MPKVVYNWNPPPTWKFPGDAQVIGEHMEELASMPEGLTPKTIVADASNPQSPLHPCFDWDNTTAAASWREHTARALIGSLVIVKVNDTPVSNTVRAFHSVVVADRKNAYMATVAIVDDAELRNQMLEQARTELMQWRNRYRSLVEFSRIFSAIDSLLPALIKLPNVDHKSQRVQE